MDIFNWIYSGKVVQTPLKCWKQVTLNYDIDKKDVHICHSADHVEKESKKVTISLKMPKIDTLDALEEHEEHEDDYQTNSNW